MNFCTLKNKHYNRFYPKKHLECISTTVITTNIHIDKPYSVLVHYQITLYSHNKNFYSKRMINYDNAGSPVHSGSQIYKTATGFYMANLNPGYYTFEVHYKSPVAINM